MNNTDFRRFVLTSSNEPANSPTSTSASASRQDATPSSLGSRSRANIPMTPRTVQGTNSSTEFARQLAAHNNNDPSHAASQKHKSSAAPKGVKLAKGYIDRARERMSKETQEQATHPDDREARVRALEEQLKLGQIDTATFESLRDNITGGDISATHLVKGLDRKLLERVRKGEDVLGTGAATSSQGGSSAPQAQAQAQPEPGVDEQLGELEQRDVAPIQHEQAAKKGEMAPPPKPLAGTKRSRDAILAELKASRKAAAAASAAASDAQAPPQSQLGSRFRKLGDPAASAKQPRIEHDEKGREVLITVDEHGRVKRKVRKAVAAKEPTKTDLLMPDRKAQPLGMAVPAGLSAAKATGANALGLDADDDNDNDDIFQGVDADFDPLEALKQSAAKTADTTANDEDGSSSSSSDSEDGEDSHKHDNKNNDEQAAIPTPSAQTTAQAPLKHNYFNEQPSDAAAPAPASLNDPSILSSLKRAAALAPQSSGADPDAQAADEGGREGAGLSETAKRLFQRDRDMDDMDMGFGSSRFGDEDDDDGGGRMKLAEWKGAGAGGGAEDNDDDDGRGRGGQKQRKRGKKKRKGDKDSAGDVLKVLEGRKKG